MISREALHNALKYLNTSRQRQAMLTQASDFTSDEAEHVFDLLFPSNRTLAVYGSLMPGKENHHVMEGISGSWEPGTVRGYLHDNGWGAGMGYPSMVWDPSGEEIPVQVLVSADLPDNWDRLDYFEGEDYLRILAPVYKAGEVRWVANIYHSVQKIDG